MELIDIREVETVNADKGYHWFDADTLRFFKSRYAQTAYLNHDRTRAFFVSSEWGPSGPRAYSVRVCDMTNGNITTIGTFQGYSTRAKADRAARYAAEQVQGTT